MEPALLCALGGVGADLFGRRGQAADHFGGLSGLDHGVVGDLVKVLPELAAKVKASK